MNKKAFLIFVVLLLGFVLIGCVRVNTGDVGKHTLSENQEYEKLDFMDVDMEMGVGELIIAGGSSDLFQGDFIYTIDSWKPEIHYRSMNKTGHLSMTHPSKMKGINIGKHEYQWNIALNDEPPMDLSLELGVGRSDLSLGTLNLRNVDIEVGIGESKIDLRGDWKEDVEINIEGGIGKATIYLPKNIGVRVEIDGGIGTISAKGLNKNDNIYTNETYNNAPHTLRIDIEAGIGEIELK